MMEAEQKNSVVWTYNDNKSKANSQRYNLRKDLVKVLHRRLHSSIGTTVTGFTKAVTTSTMGEQTHFYDTHAFRDTNGIIGHLFISNKVYCSNQVRY